MNEITALQFGGNSANWAWYKTKDQAWTVDVLGSLHSKVDGKWVLDPSFHIRVWKNRPDGGHDYNNPDFDFYYKPKQVPSTRDKLPERTLTKVVRQHMKEQGER
jgi:hypothetical protein